MRCHASRWREPAPKRISRATSPPANVVVRRAPVPAARTAGGVPPTVSASARTAAAAVRRGDVVFARSACSGAPVTLSRRPPRSIPARTPPPKDGMPSTTWRSRTTDSPPGASTVVPSPRPSTSAPASPSAGALSRSQPRTMALRAALLGAVSAPPAFSAERTVPVVASRSTTAPAPMRRTSAARALAVAGRPSVRAVVAVVAWRVSLTAGSPPG